LVEVLKILEESKEANVNNKLLKEKSDELSKLTEQLKEANINLIKKDHQKDEFLDTVSHELKTPVTGIRAATELILDDDEMDSEIKKQFLKNILQDSDRLSRLIHNILDFEKLSTGRDHLILQKNAIKLTIEKAINGVSQIANKKGIKLLVPVSESIEFKYDEDRILQVLTNLLSNAIKFCPNEKGVINVEFEKNENHVFVYVVDNGIGIPEEDQSYIFDKFFQSINQNTIKPQGSGLGLAISKQIVEMHIGKIWIEKTNKNGTIFGFKLPFN
jgi:signal transduction histidine kinase